MSVWISRSYRKNSERIEQIRNISLFCIALSSAASYLYYQYSLYVQKEGGILPFEYLYKYVCVHAFLDLFFGTHYDNLIHHLFIMGIIFYSEYHQACIEDKFLFIYPLLKTEITSIFYVLRYWLSENTLLYNANIILFYLSFLKFRIYDFYVELIHHNLVFHRIFQVYSSNMSSLLYLSVYGLYSLNLYWVFILNKMVYKKIVSFVPINTDFVCHYLCSTLYAANIPVSLLLSHPFARIGTIVHSCSAYLYHKDIYRKLYLKQIDEYVAPSKDNKLDYLIYRLSIHIRSFLSLSIYYPGFNRTLLSACLHTVSMYDAYEHVKVIEHMEPTSFLFDQRRFLALPFLMDGLMLGLHSPDKLAISLYLLYFSMTLLHVVNPFYKLTPLAFAIGFTIQTGLLTQTY